MQFQTAYEKYIFAIRAVRDISPTLADAVEGYVRSISSRSDAAEYSLKPGDRCPKCGNGTVVLRTKSDPPFLGCSEFKNSSCRFSASCTREQAQRWIAEGRTGYKQYIPAQQDLSSSGSVKDQATGVDPAFVGIQHIPIDPQTSMRREDYISTTEQAHSSSPTVVTTWDASKPGSIEKDLPF